MATADQIEALVSWAGSDLPEDYLEVLHTRGGEFCNDVVRLYAADELIERNETYETKRYCPGFLTIGDDSGGRAIVIALGSTSGPVYVVDHGYMSPKGFHPLAPDLNTWLAQECPVDD